jgi:hypothetical protein
MASYTETIAKFTVAQRTIYISIIASTLTRIDKTNREINYLWNYMDRRNTQITALAGNIDTQIADEKLLETLPIFESIARLYPGESTDLDNDNTAMFNILNRLVNTGTIYTKESIDLTKNTEYLANYLDTLSTLRTDLETLKTDLEAIQ